MDVPSPAARRAGSWTCLPVEIATLCRVAIVVDMVQRFVDQFVDKAATTAPSRARDEMPVDGRFTSQESYFPVFDASVKDLQLLEADVVKPITAFYTYMKVMRDKLRKLAELPHPKPGSDDVEAWNLAIKDIIYMQFSSRWRARGTR